MARLKDIYNSEIRDAMQKKFGYKNVMQIPKLEKIVINMGVGEAKENAKVLDSAVKDLETISGQHAIITKAKHSVANFCGTTRWTSPAYRTEASSVSSTSASAVWQRTRKA